MHEYHIEFFQIKDGKRVFRARFPINAPDRARAVHKAQLWYWARFRGRLGPAHEVLEVDDPCGEVRYGPHFDCSAKVNRMLPHSVITRVLAQANGELVLNTAPWKKHHAPSPFRRRKRRRDFGKFVLPNVRQMGNGVLYYRVLITPQKVVGNRRYRKRKYKDVRLVTRSLREAALEIEARGLHLLHQQKSKRVVRSRSLTLLRKRSERFADTQQAV